MICGLLSTRRTSATEPVELFKRKLVCHCAGMLSADSPSAQIKRWLFAAIEAPFLPPEKELAVVDKTKRRGRAPAATYYKMGVGAGYLHGALRHMLAGACMWRPLPGSWRAVLGLNRQKTAAASARVETNDVVLQWAQANTREGIVGQYDRANAIGICLAYASVLSELRALDRPR